MARPRAFVLRLCLIGASLAALVSGKAVERQPRRIVSYHGPSPIVTVEAPKLGPEHAIVFSAQHLQPFIHASKEPAPVREEQNEPPPPDSRTRGRAPLNPLGHSGGSSSLGPMTNPAGFAQALANQFGAQPLQAKQPPVQPAQGIVPGVVQVVNQIIPGAPPRVVLPPPPEEVPPEARLPMPISIDPTTGLPRRVVDPKFRLKFLNPKAPAIEVPLPNMVMFGKGFGGAAIVDVLGGAPEPSRPQVQTLPATTAGGLATFGETTALGATGGGSLEPFGGSAFGGNSASSGSSASTGPAVSSFANFEFPAAEGFSSSPSQSSGLSTSSFGLQSFGSSSRASSSGSSSNDAERSSGFVSSPSEGGLSSLMASLTKDSQNAVSISTSTNNLPGATSSFSTTVFH